MNVVGVNLSNTTLFLRQLTASFCRPVSRVHTDLLKIIQSSRISAMSIDVELQNQEAFADAMTNLRVDGCDPARTAWIILGHVDNSPNRIHLVASDNTEEASIEGWRSQLASDQVMYCLIRLSCKDDLTITTKYIYVHWIGEEVAFAMQGKFGVVHGSVEQHFRPYHLMLETGNTEALLEEEMRLGLEGKGRARETEITDKSASKPETESKRQFVGAYHSIAVDEDLKDAMDEIRPDTSETNWVIGGFAGGDPKKNLELKQKGSGDIATVVKHLDDNEVAYILYRTTDIIDEIETVKFVYVYWVGDLTKPMFKGQVSA
ncbi:hypothetical protein CAPTEDRAFT_226752, partial [Capitella teleta]